MIDVKKLKQKYSGQKIPDWELENKPLTTEPDIKGKNRKIKLQKDDVKDGNFNPDLH